MILSKICNLNKNCIFKRKSGLNLTEEEQLIMQIKTEPSKFGVLFDAYYALIFRFIFNRTSNFEVSREIASETFMKAFLNFYSFKWKGISVSYWLYRIANNEIGQYFRKNKYTPSSIEFLIESKGWDIEDPKNTIENKAELESEVEKHQNYKRIQEKMKLLALPYQEVLGLRYFEKKNLKEIAIILEKPEGTIKSLHSRAIAQLKNMLS